MMQIRWLALIPALVLTGGCDALRQAYLPSDVNPDEAGGPVAGRSPDRPTNVNQRELLAAHNRYRRAVGVPDLVWSDTVAASARKWAEHLAATRSFRHSSTGYGENIWAGTRGGFSPTQMVDRWGSEQRYFVAGTVFPDVCGDDWRRCAHYTQMIWRDTQALGCGMATDGARDYLVCQYDPPGNYRGRTPY